jgi:two-component system, OmpR family, response regulator RegX3
LYYIYIGIEDGGSAVKKLLIVEDERPMAEAIAFSLRKEGYQVDIALDGERGWQMCSKGDYDIILLDLMLPKLDGLEICRRLRQDSSTAIIMLTAKDSDLDKVLGLEMGADDYITKPFNMRELAARVKAVLRRVQAEQASERGGRLVMGNITIDEERHEVTVGPHIVEMPLMEYRLLEIFMKNPGKALPRSYLIGRAWGGDFYGQTKTLDVHIRRLREKIERNPAKPQHIITVRGVGYRFETGDGANE